MTRTIAEIAIDFDSLTDNDFDPANNFAQGYERLSSLCEELQTTNEPNRCVPILFRAMERLDNQELGNPGPLVHAIESWLGSYETMLEESVRRKPGRLSVWMVNRILNSNPPDAVKWLELLRNVTLDQTAATATKNQASDYIKHQVNRTNHCN